VLEQLWTTASRVINNAVRLVPMSELNVTNRRIDTLFALVAEERLALNLTQNDPTAKKGVFTDPFFDDDFRDAGIAQTAAIFDQRLTLGIEVAVHTQSLALPATLTVDSHSAVISQPLRTGAMKINPYLAFGVTPGSATLTPAVDFWTEVQTDWLSPITRRLNVQSGTPNPNRRNIFAQAWSWLWSWPWRRVITRTEEVAETERDLVGTEYVDAQFLREIVVEFALGGFGAAEALASMLFDGRAVTAEAIGGGAIQPADGNGDLTGQFTIPAGVPVGTKLVEFAGAGGTEAQATFVGRGVITIETLRLVTSIRTQSRIIEPLAQTFVLDESRQISGIKLWFTAVGSTNVLIEIRDVSLGLPTLRVAADVLLAPGAITPNGWTTFLFDTPVFLEAGHEYCPVIACDDAVSECAVAELGAYDSTAQQWVTSQPYQVGVLLSSANNRTWTPHQTKDLTFEMLAVNYASATRNVGFTSVDVTDADHLMVLAAVERPTEDCDVVFKLTADGVVYEVVEAQSVTLAARFTGTVTIEAVLTGTTEVSPTLHKDFTLVAAKRLDSSDYVTRAMQANSGTKITAYYDALIPATASIDAFYEDGEDNWVALPVVDTTALGDGWTEIKREVTGFSEPETRIKLVLNVTSQKMPLTENLRVAIT